MKLKRNITRFIKQILKSDSGSENKPKPEDYEAISEFFDVDYYLANNKDVECSQVDPRRHYLTHGWKELRNPSADFNTEFYLTEYSDIGDNVCPLVHYGKTGSKDNRPTNDIETRQDTLKPGTKIDTNTKLKEEIEILSKHFDTQFYLHSNEDVDPDKIDPIKHYCLHGWKEGRDPAPLFSSKFYLNSYKDVAASGVNPYLHYIISGWKERRDPSKGFSTSYYLAKYKDIRDAKINPLTHYLRNGKAEGRLPKEKISINLDNYNLEEEMEYIRDEFDENYYLENYADVKAAGIDPLKHYCEHGWKEFRDPNRNFSTSYYQSQISEGKINPFLHYLVIGVSLGTIPKVVATPLAECLPTGDLYNFEPSASKKIAVMAHIFYEDMTEEIKGHLFKIPRKFDLLISTNTEAKQLVIEKEIQGIPNCEKVVVKVVENRGRDIAPFLVTFGKQLLNYDFALHLHSKRSPYGTMTEGWFDFLMDHLLHSPHYVESIFRQFETNDDIGIVAPQYLHSLLHLKHWGVNYDMAKFFMRDIGIEIPPESKELEFPMGSMFWFKVDAIKQLLNTGLTYDNFPEEGGQLDGTISHSIERLFAITAASNGYKMKIFRPLINEGPFVPRLVDIYEAPFTLPKSENPLISIVIPVYNQFDYTNACIRSIVEHTNFEETPYEIIIGDDCSSDETKQIEAFFPNIVRIVPETNQGFLGNCNNAIKHAKAEYIFLLNNDTQVQANTLKYLLDTFNKHPKAVIAGSKLIYPDNILQEAGGIVWDDASGANYGRNDNPNRPEYRYVKETDYISGAAIMIKKSFWNEVDGFDTQLTPAYYEDTDLCMTARDLGYQVILQPASQVVHFEGKSHGTDTTSGIKSYQVVNKEKFYKKWKTSLEATHTDHKPIRARERSQNKKIAYVLDYFLPDYDRHCGARHTFQYIKLLQSMGYVVKYLADAFSEERQEIFAKELEQMGIETFFPEGIFRTANWSQLLADRANDIDLVVLNRPHIAQKYLPILKEKGLKTLLFNHDLHSLRSKRLAEEEGNKEAYQAALEEEINEKNIYSQVDHIVTPSSYEATYVKKHWNMQHITNIPLYVEAPTNYKVTQGKKENTVLFVGGMLHKPNAHGIKWFVFEVLPLITKKVSDFKLHIVGTGCPEEIKALKNSNIIIHNGISDEELFDLYSNSKASIVPLHSGAGVKGKVIESLFYEVPVVATSIGLEGITGLEKIYPPSDTAKDFAKSTIDILESQSDEINQIAIQEILEKSFSANAGKSKLKHILDKLLCNI